MDIVGMMPRGQSSRYFKVVVCFDRRPDGGLRAWSDSVPGFILSHHDVDLLLADIKPALETILSARLGMTVEAAPLDDIRDFLENEGLVDKQPVRHLGPREYVAHYA